MKFTISPDENPGDPGTTAGGLNERELNLSVIAALVRKLESAGASVSFDPSITYTTRVGGANANGTDVLVAIAHNAGPPDAEGAVFVFCNDPAARGFGKQMAAATAVGDSIVNAGLASRSGTYTEDAYE